MKESRDENIVLMALMVLTKDDVLAGASEVGMSEEEVTEDLIELVKDRVSQGLAGWREGVKDMVREALKCPLGLVCSPSCAWREVGGCTLPREVK